MPVHVPFGMALQVPGLRIAGIQRQPCSVRLGKVTDQSLAGFLDRLRRWAAGPGDPARDTRRTSTGCPCRCFSRSSRRSLPDRSPAADPPIARSAKPGFSKPRASKVVAQAQRPWLSRWNLAVPAIISGRTDIWSPDFPGIADAQTAPAGLFHGCDERRSAAVDMVVRVDPLERNFRCPAPLDRRGGRNHRQQLPSRHIAGAPFTDRWLTS